MEKAAVTSPAPQKKIYAYDKMDFSRAFNPVPYDDFVFDPQKYRSQNEEGFDAAVGVQMPNAVVPDSSHMGAPGKSCEMRGASADNGSGLSSTLLAEPETLFNANRQIRQDVQVPITGAPEHRLSSHGPYHQSLNPCTQVDMAEQRMERDASSSLVPYTSGDFTGVFTNPTGGGGGPAWSQGAGMV